ncbi:sulfate permease [Microbacterium pygmaeum]|uniref:Sulfate permease n=1 Tax=Microbacterium pygmaeum TaxID=370764 RepID=A0A1G7XIR5_9MICO|nr:sulfate permease [Microbacterium pygmaeum]SDG84054.1 hypothetical protein SAMN04489810_1438 [Microbacterium pygmaeum]
MFGLVWMLGTRVRIFMRRFMPTNMLVAKIFTRRGLKWGAPAMLIAVIYMAAAVVARGMVEQGGPGWMNLLVILFIWNAIKFIVVGPVSAIYLLRVRLREAKIRRALRVPVMSEGVVLQRDERPSVRAFH